MKKIIFALCLVSIFTSCKKDVVEGPQGPQGIPGTNGSTTTGTISGTVRHYDTYSSLITANLNTCTVSVDGTTLSTVTDASGNYTLTEIPNGIYDLSFMKTGTGLKKINQVVLPGTGNLYLNTTLYDKPNFQFTGGMVKDTIMFSSPTCLIKLSFTPISKARTAIIIFGNSNNVDIAQPNSYQLEYELNLSSNQSNLQSTISLLHPIWNVFLNGSTIYAKVYPISNFNSTYYDPQLDKQVHTDYGIPLAGTFTITKP